VTREEFSDLTLSYLEEIAAFARRLTGNTADADDLVQATFERAFESWRGLRESAACRAWLFRIARNLFVDGRRASAVRLQLSLAEGTESGAPAFIVPAEAVERLTTRELESALDQLPGNQREALLLCDLWGFQAEAPMPTILAIRTSSAFSERGTRTRGCPARPGSGESPKGKRRSPWSRSVFLLERGRSLWLADWSASGATATAS